MESPESYWRLGDGAGTWIFGGLCAVIVLVLLRLVLRERITLQGSMSYLVFLLLLGGMALFPDLTGRVAHALGFYSLANFFFCTAIAALAVLHLRSLVTISRIQLRSITLVQELAILRETIERLERVERERKRDRPRTDAQSADDVPSVEASRDR